jgi:hypothetical protein
MFAFDYHGAIRGACAPPPRRPALFDRPAPATLWSAQAGEFGAPAVLSFEIGPGTALYGFGRSRLLQPQLSSG